jgi:DNA-binding winged helix-turn-helix (wHTH) protein/TolB-like protein
MSALFPRAYNPGDSSQAITMRDAFRLGEWTVRPRLNLISRGGRDVHLRARVMDLLAFFVEHTGEVLSKDDILNHVWGAKFVAESSLTTALTEIRQAFEDDAHHAWLIETIPKRGYRLIATPIFAADADRWDGGRRPPRLWRNHWLLLAALASVAALVIVLALIHRAPAATPRRRLVIVTPLKNSGDAGQEHFAAGVSAALADALWRVHAVQVVPVGSDGELSRFVSDSPAGTVVLGGVVTPGREQVLAHVWLDDASTHRRLWSASYDRPVADRTAVSVDVANRIATELNSSLDAESPSKAVDPGAYDEYLRGRYGELRWMTGGCVDAEPHFIRALQLDPAFVGPLIELAYCYVYPDRLQRPTTETGPKARAVISKALQLDRNSGAAHALNAIIHYRLDYDWSKAADEFALAHRLAPDNAEVSNAYGEFLYLTGRGDDGLRLQKGALEINPFTENRNIAYGFGLLVNRRYADAAIQLRRTLTLYPDATGARYFLTEAEARLGHGEIAAREYTAWMDAAVQPIAEGDIRRALVDCRLGRWPACERADLALAEMEIRQPASAFKLPYGRYAGAYFQARRYARAGDANRAMLSLEQARRERHHLVPFIGIDPAFDGLRTDPRFQELRRAVGPPAK